MAKKIIWTPSFLSVGYHNLFSKGAKGGIVPNELPNELRQSVFGTGNIGIIQTVTVQSAVISKDEGGSSSRRFRFFLIFS
jgi:hypothetical protein